MLVVLVIQSSSSKAVVVGDGDGVDIGDEYMVGDLAGLNIQSPDIVAA